MPLDYQVFDPSPCCFPQPRVSVLPQGFQLATSGDGPSTSLRGHGLHFSRGRYALGDAYRRAGLGYDTVLLAPAYHCVTMLDPALALGAEVLLYPLTSDLAPEIGLLDELANRSEKPVKVLLATHFFGFVRDFSGLKQWCDARGICFVEDCSHTLCTERFQAKGVGVHGHFVASSPYKFFPGVDGGWLYSQDATALAGYGPTSAGWLDELRGMKHCLEALFQPRIGASDIASLDGQLALFARQAPDAGMDQRRTRSAQSSQYQLACEDRKGLRGSRWLVNHSSIGANIRRRQANYRSWLNTVAGLPNCRPLYPDLPDHVVPYMFPLYIDYPMPHFYWLKHLAVPVWRWDELAVSNCMVAEDYRLHLLHLPCHQSLCDDEMKWLMAALSKVMRKLLPGGAQ